MRPSLSSLLPAFSVLIASKEKWFTVTKAEAFADGLFPFVTS